MQNDFADPAGQSLRRTAATVSSRWSMPRSSEPWAPVRQWCTPRTGIPRRLPTSPRMAVSGPCIVWRTPGAPSSTPRLIVAGPTIRKGIAGEDGYSGFTVADPETGATPPTGMDRLLEELDIAEVVVVGLALDYCVKATALDARASRTEDRAPPASHRRGRTRAGGWRPGTARNAQRPESNWRDRPWRPGR